MKPTLLHTCVAIALAFPAPAAFAQAPEGSPEQTQRQASAGKESSKAGELAFNNHCRTCHSVKEGDHRLGPALNDIIGKKAGSQEGYAAYSNALANSGVVWDEETLDRFIADPEAVIRNNNMKPYSGITDAEVRQQIVEYLASAE